MRKETELAIAPSTVARFMASVCFTQAVHAPLGREDPPPPMVEKGSQLPPPLNKSKDFIEQGTRNA